MPEAPTTPSPASSTSARPAGYLSPDYAASLAEWGTPVALPAAGGWLLRRPISGTDAQDAMACYPLFCCADWRALAGDFEALRSQLVSVALVTDPFGAFDEPLLRATFDRAIAFKEHFFSDLNEPVNEKANFHHRKHARRALKDAVIDVPPPESVLDDWTPLYDNLSQRHGITGIRAFSRASFAAQLRVPGMVAIRARCNTTGEVLGMQLWYVQNDVVYSHLSAYSEIGYKKRIAYALNWTANEHFTGKVRWLLLGAGAGSGSASSGLVDYKRGWSTGSRTAYFCGKILQPDAYADICRRKNQAETAYFPAYRHGEF